LRLMDEASILVDFLFIQVPLTPRQRLLKTRGTTERSGDFG